MGNEQTKNEVATGVGIQSMDQQLQRKFSKVKIVVKGDRNSGKTCLFHRLQGKPFLEFYIPTEEIQVTSILWSYKDTLDTVKVEVWDVVDKGKIHKKKKKGNLKLFNDLDVQTPADQPLDAQFLDVYKGTHGVIFMFDMTKQWTYQYVTRELPLVSYHIPIVVMGNFRDMGEHRVVTTLEVMNFVEFLERPEGSADVKYAECSMKDGFGLKYLHRFFSIPFLHLQQESLLRQLQVNRELLVSTMEELAVDENSEDQNYQLFMDAINLKQHQREKRLAEEKAAAAASENVDTTTNNMEEKSTDSKTLVAKANSGPNMETVVSQESPATRKSSFKEKLSQKFSSKKKSPIMAKKEQKPVTVAKATTKSSRAAITDIDSFVPDEEMDNSFLAEDGDEEHNKLYEKETDSDDNEDNPLVAADEDIDSSDEEQQQQKQQQQKQQVKTVKPVQSSGDSDAEEKQETIETKPKQEQKTPPTPIKPASTRPTLLSAKSVEITESSSEEDDEAERLVQKKLATKPAKTSAPPTQKSSGLTLQHSIPTTSKPDMKKTTEDITTTEVKEEKKKKKSSQKKKKQKEEKDDTTILPAVATTTTTSDPFSSSLLDAWLDSPSGDSLTPVLKLTTATESSKKKVTVHNEPGDATKELTRWQWLQLTTTLVYW
ncbi:rab-like protein 6 isoform X2 [Dysidea avara]|uniref:rab-like protein 6 isoform X2 n=1 Tax=Dysidea avara TaxID=196820 RepID=UPI003330987E